MAQNSRPWAGKERSLPIQEAPENALYLISFWYTSRKKVKQQKREEQWKHNLKSKVVTRGTNHQGKFDVNFIYTGILALKWGWVCGIIYVNSGLYWPYSKASFWKLSLHWYITVLVHDYSRCMPIWIWEKWSTGSDICFWSHHISWKWFDVFFSLVLFRPTCYACSARLWITPGTGSLNDVS